MTKGWLCPHCFTKSERAGYCTCGGTFLLAAPPNKRPIIIGYLALVEDAPAPDSLLGGMFDGITRHLSNDSEWQIICKHRGNIPVWMWQTRLSAFPRLPDLVSAEEKYRMAPIISALAETKLILLDAPEPSPDFQAQSAWMLGIQAAPSFAELIDRLHYIYSICPGPPSKIALLDPKGALSDKDRVRVASACNDLRSFKDAKAALDWLMGPYSQEATPHSAAPGLEPGIIRIADVGGVTGRLFLSQLHRMTLNGVEARPWAERIELTRDRWLRSRILVKPTEEGLHWGQLHQLRNSPPVPGDSVPPLQGCVKNWWRGEWPFVVEMWNKDAPVTKDEKVNSTAILIGVGSSRYRGEKDLSELLERLWTSELTPFGILTGPRTDPLLLQWAHQNFPGLPEYSTSLDGVAQALRNTIVLAKRMATS